MLWLRRNSHPDDSDAARPKVKVHTTWFGRQYVDAEDLMGHPDVVKAVRRFGKILRPIIANEQRRIRDHRRADRPQSNGS